MLKINNIKTEAYNKRMYLFDKQRFKISEKTTLNFRLLIFVFYFCPLNCLFELQRWFILLSVVFLHFQTL